MTIDRPAIVAPKAPLPTPEIAGIAGSPGAWATCPAKTVADWLAKIVTPAVPPVPPVYSHTIPLPGVDVWIGPLKVPPSAASAWAKVGHVAAPVVTAPVVVVLAGGELAGGAVEDAEVGGVVVELVAAPGLPDPQPATTKPTKAHAASAARLSTPVTLDPDRCPGQENHRNHRIRGVRDSCSLD